jgi:hypothetical protein
MGVAARAGAAFARDDEEHPRVPRRIADKRCEPVIRVTQRSGGFYRNRVVPADRASTEVWELTYH